MMASGASLRARAMPPRPSPAAITRNPSNSRASRSPSTRCGSSSTTSTVRFTVGMVSRPLYTATSTIPRRMRLSPAASGRRGRERRPERAEVTGRDAGHREESRVVGRADRREVPDVRQQRLLRLLAETLHVVERRDEATLLADPHARAIREAMRLVPHAREKEERSRVALERNGVLLTRQIHAIGELLLHAAPARHVRARRLALLGESDDAQVVQPEIVGSGDRNGELPSPPVDDEEVGQVPVVVAHRALA